MGIEARERSRGERVDVIEGGERGDTEVEEREEEEYEELQRVEEEGKEGNAEEGRRVFCLPRIMPTPARLDAAMDFLPHIGVL